MPKGYALLLSGYLTWGLFPLYWAQLAHTPALEVTLHRIVWSVPVLALLVWPVAARKSAFLAAWRNINTLKLLTLSATLISINWGVYVWAVAVNRVVEASMGYFLSPLLHILAGVVIFKEHLNRLQWLAIGFAALGVAWYALGTQQFPWFGLTVGVSFAGYGVLRKKIDINAVPGLFVETLLLIPLALLALFWLAANGEMQFLNTTARDSYLMALGGLVTVAPLALFTAGTRLLPMTTVGILFFITPTLQFFSGLFLLGESMNADKLTAFVMIWLGLGFYVIALLKAENSHR